MISQSLRDKLKGVTFRVDPQVRTSSSFLGEDLNIPLLALMTIMSLKHYSKDIKVIEMQMILGNIFLRKYQLEKFIAEALASSPHLCERATEAIVFLESAGLVIIHGSSERYMTITARGEDFLKVAQKNHPSLIRRLRLLIISLRKEGLAFS